jgi:hypothetical protein
MWIGARRLCVLFGVSSGLLVGRSVAGPVGEGPRLVVNRRGLLGCVSAWRRFVLCLACVVGLWVGPASVSDAASLAGGSATSPITSPLGVGGEEALESDEAQQAAQEALRSSPEAVAAREESTTKYVGENAQQAAKTLEEAFPAVITEQDGGPGPGGGGGGGGGGCLGRWRRAIGRSALRAQSSSGSKLVRGM